ncbi:MAG: glycosyltransferase [Patescibacteria group bacterium]|nr:glycosyltransferase [Patescibacteria group bacterium]
MAEKNTRLLSVIIPVFRQEKTIKRNLLAILSELDMIKVQYEVIVVVDGFVDKTFEQAKMVRNKRVHVYGYEHNRGKGYAVRYGMARSKGDVIAFIDAGGEIRESGIPMLLEHMRWYNADIIVGSKRHPASKIVYPWYRKILSFGYQSIVKILFGLSIRDTQVGLKVYRREVLEDVLPRIFHDGFSFDIELLAVAHHLGYTRIYESPVDLDFSKVSSTIRSFKTYKIIIQMLIDTLDVFLKLKFFSYYDNTNNKRWHNDPDVILLKKRNI